MTREQLDAIRARVEAATPGPWSYSISIGQDRRYATGPTHDGGLGPDDEDAREKAHADALLIAKAPTDLLALLAEVERLRVALTAYGIDHRLGWDECRSCRQRNEHRESAKSRQKNYHLPSCVFYSMFSRKEDKP